MKLAEVVYESCPHAFRNILVSARGAQFILRRYRRAYFAHRSRIPTLYRLDEDSATRYQLALLQELIGHAKARSPYYSDKLRSIDPADVRSLDDLRQLPILDKETLRARAGEIYTIPAWNAVVGHTGGTTGKSIAVRYTRTDYQRRMAEIDGFRFLHGFRHGMRRATFSGRQVVPPGEHSGVYWRNNYLLRQRLYSTFHLTQETLPRFVANLNELRPEVIDGFPASISEIADWVTSTGQKLAFKPKAIFTTSETLTRRMRDSIHRAFGVQPRNQYASSEGAPFIVECPRGRLHFLPHTGVIEVDDLGRILVTSFTTHGTPLIRYDIGDNIAFSQEKCDCGLTGPVVGEIRGRDADYVVTLDGRRLYATHLGDVVKYMPNSVIAMQYRQESTHTVELDLVADPAKFRSGDLELVSTALGRLLGPGMTLRVNRVESIPREPSGKTRLVKNFLNRC